MSREGMVSVGGNTYSVPDATRSRLVEVHSLADEVRIFENGPLIAVHPVLEGRKQRRVHPDHRRSGTVRRLHPAAIDDGGTLQGAGDRVLQRSLAFYDAAGKEMAQENRP
ncbi:Mu transposase domain-containing protein [Phyllobacterium sophorae]|uniref:Mu transposase domain-containing protein n=1 Tax=Phyllobacterium sophorae TaxID=1520277 RepID=UPI003CC945B2